MSKDGLEARGTQRLEGRLFGCCLWTELGDVMIGECELLGTGMIKDTTMDNVRLCVRLAWRLRERTENIAMLATMDDETMTRVGMMSIAAGRHQQHYTELGIVLAKRTLVWMEPEAVTRLLLVLQTNAMRVPDGANGSPLAVALYAYGSAANHSCAPSAIAAFSKSALELIVCRRLGANEPVTVGYVDVGIPKPVRRFLLYDSWNFRCACERCREESGGDVVCADCGQGITCDSDTMWRLFESLGDSEWYCGQDARKRYGAFCAEEPQLPAHGCARAAVGAQEAISLASKASQLAGISHKPKLRFAELVWQLVFGADKRLLVVRGYFWRCAALRYALHCVNVANEMKAEEDMLPLFSSAARVNEMIWQAYEDSWLDGPLALGCAISQIRCDAWLASLKMERSLHVGMESHEHTAKVRVAIERAKVLAARVYSQCRASHAICEDLIRTIFEITGE